MRVGVRGAVVVGGLLVGCVVAACGAGERGARTGLGKRGDQPPADSPGARGGSTGGGGAAGGTGMTGCGGRPTSPDPLPSPASAFPPGSICERDGWCWYDPLPSGDHWGGVAGAGRTDLWIAGDGAVALHFDGGRWKQLPSPIRVRSIWAAAEDDVWFGGQDLANSGSAVIAHWDGVALTQTATLGSVLVWEIWGSGPRDVYAITSSSLHHWDGFTWTLVPEVNVSNGGGSVSGSGPRDVWVGTEGGMSHFDGVGWSPVPALAGVVVYDVSVVAPDDVWAITLRGDPVAEHFDGVAWTVSFSNPRADGAPSEVHASSSGDVWLLTNRGFTGTSVARGVLNHFDGNVWSPEILTPTSLDEIATTEGFGVVAVGGSGGMLRLAADPTPRFVDLRVGPTATLRSTFGSSPADMWAVGDGGTVLHYDGRQVVPVPSGTTANLTDVWGTGPGDVWVVGARGTVLHYDGRAFTSVPSGTVLDLHAVFTAGPDDVWIAGDQGTLKHGGGLGFGAAAVPGINAMPIRDLHGLAHNDVWLAGGAFVIPGVPTGSHGFVSHFDGAAWSAIQELTFEPQFGSEPIVRIWELAPNDIWALTDATLFGFPSGRWHFDGAAWTGSRVGQEPAPFMFPARCGTGTFAFGPRDRWCVGTEGSWQRSTQ